MLLPLEQKRSVKMSGVHPALLFILWSAQRGSSFQILPNVAFPRVPTIETGVIAQTCKQDVSSKERRTNLSMIANLGFNPPSQKEKQQPSLPRDVKEAVSKCREAVQKALEGRLSRMDVEFPVGTKFGVEKDSSSKKGKGGGRGRGNLSSSLGADDEDGAGAPTRDMLDTSDRELARLFVEMFQPVGGSAISVVFGDDTLADMARTRWKGDASAACNIMSFRGGARRNRKALGAAGAAGGMKKKKKMGFAAKMAQEMESSPTAPSGPFKLPEGCEVALFVAPGPKELVAVNRICGEVGMGTLVILLNARLGLVDNFGTDEARDLFLEEFQPVYHLAAAPQRDAPGCLLHRAYPSDWILARKPKVGQPKTISTYDTRPTPKQCQEAYDTIEIGDMEKGVENVLENVANWFS